jgi:hypothetical protein
MALGILDLRDIAPCVIVKEGLFLIRIFDEFELAGAVVIVGAGLCHAVDSLDGVNQVAVAIVLIGGAATEGIGFGQAAALGSIGVVGRLLEMVGFGEFVALGV